MSFAQSRWFFLGFFVTLIALLMLHGYSQAAPRARNMKMISAASGQALRLQDSLWALHVAGDDYYTRNQVEVLQENDPWGHPLVAEYRLNNGLPSLQVTSAGPDNEFDTEDDIFVQESGPHSADAE